MKAIFVMLCVCFINSTYATKYYISSKSGNDSRTALQAQNSSTPWKTFRRLDSLFFSTLKPGDAILLKRGETFYGSIIVNNSGTPGAPIVIGAYGSGARPVINSLVTLKNWVSMGNGIWESSDTSLGATVNMVLINGVQYAMGRYPNDDAANNGYLNFESHVGTSSITDKQLSASINWTGAELVLRPRHWILDRDSITSQAGNKISYSAASSAYEPYQNYGYFIQNSIKTLDKFGEWYYNRSTKKFSVYFGSGKPTSYVVEASTIKNVIYSVTWSNIVFDNLAIRGANGSGFSLINCNNTTIQNCDILFSGQNGVNVVKDTNFTILNCNILNQNNNGIDLEGIGSTIRNNKIVNTFLLPGMGKSGNGTGVGISINSNNSIVEYNEIRNAGYQGIYFNGSNITIKNNLIDTFCITKDDGGGIYSTKGVVDYTKRKVIGNIIMNGIGTGYGTNLATKKAAHGFYVDNNASPVDIRDNTIANCSSNGINIHNVFGMTMENNTVFNNTIQLNMIEDADHAPIRNCILTGNILFSKFTDQYTSMIVSFANDIKSFGKFDSNYYARPINDSLIIYSKYNSASKGVTQIFNLPGWKAKYGMDTHSKTSAKQLAAKSNPDDSIRFEYNAGIANISIPLNGTYVDATGKLYSNSIILKPYTSVVLIKTAGIIPNIAPLVSVTSPNNNAAFTANSSVKISAAATDDGSVVKIDFYNGSSLLGTAKTSPYSFTWNSVPAGNYSITAIATDNSALTTKSTPVKISVTASKASRGSSARVSGKTSAPFAALGTMRAGNNDPRTFGGKFLSTPDLPNPANFKLLPNPGINTIQMYFDGLQIYQKAGLTIYNTSGAVIKKYPVILSGKKIAIDISSLYPGIYTIGLSTGNFNINKKFIKIL